MKMDFKELKKITGVSDKNLADNREIPGIFYDSRSVTKDSVFFAIKGVDTDGHNYIKDAYNKGAVLVIGEKDYIPPENRFYWKVSDSDAVFKKAYLAFKNFPDKKIDIIAVTGTNGKTTVTYLMESIFKTAGYNTGVIGTINYRYGDVVKKSSNTTPSFGLIVDMLDEMYNNGVKIVIIEASSHGLKQGRLEGLTVKSGIFTNLTRDHFDYHKTIEDYFDSKKLLFTKILKESEAENKFGVVNIDDKYGKKLFSLKRKIGYGLFSFGKNSKDFKIIEINSTLDNLKVKFLYKEKKYSVNSNLIGNFNGYNIVSAVSAAMLYGIDYETVVKGVENFTNVPGRMEKFTVNGVTVIIDYAHTPDAIEKVLVTVLTSKKRGNLITIFGAGGDRDPGKRAIMGKIASIYSDKVIVTSDNPRSEDPDKIIDDIFQGITNKDNVIREVDRKKAIIEGISGAKKGDVVVILGKGHEDYQIIGDKTYHFSDREIVSGMVEGNK